MAETNSVTSGTTDPKSLELNKEDLVIKSLYKLSENLITFLNKPEGYDVKLEIGKAPDIEEFYAHSAILRARSTYFYNALSKEMISKTTEGDGSGGTVSLIYTAISKTFFMSTEDNVVIFKKENITPKAFKFLLTIIYGGFTKIDGLTSLEYMDLLEAYGELGIQGFDDFLQQCFLENHGEWIRENLLLLERFSSKHEAFRDIRNFCYDQLCQNSDIVFKPSDATTINKDIIVALMKRDDLIAEEIDLWEFILQWAFSQFPDVSRENIESLKEEDVDKLKGVLKDLVPLIRFKWVTHEAFYEKVMPYSSLFDKKQYDKVMKHYFLQEKKTPHPTVQTTIIPTLDSSLEPESPAVSESASSVSSFKEPKARDKNAKFIFNENKNYVNLFSCWIDKKPYNPDYQSWKFKRLYRGSDNNFTFASFHEKCDATKDTLVIAKLKETGEIIGGYNPRRWHPRLDSGRNACSAYTFFCKKSFIFKINKDDLEKSEISHIKEPSSALCYKKDSGPNFNDLVIYNQTKPISYGQRYYEPDLNIEGSLLEDYEVYKVLPSYS